MGNENSTPEAPTSANTSGTPSGNAVTTAPAPDLTSSIDQFSAVEAVKRLSDILGYGEKTESTTISVEALCKRLRVLCREPEGCNKCGQANASYAIVGAMDLFQENPKVQLQALAALVNLCSGEGNQHRQHAVDDDCLRRVVNAMKVHLKNAEIQEMACIAVQNCCYGDDEHAVDRRRKAAEAGAIEATVQAMRSYPDLQPAQEVGIATLRVMVHRCKENKEIALTQGVKQEDLEVRATKSGGILSFRGFGTQRRRSGK